MAVEKENRDKPFLQNPDNRQTDQVESPADSGVDLPEEIEQSQPEEQPEAEVGLLDEPENQLELEENEAFTREEIEAEEEVRSSSGWYNTLRGWPGRPLHFRLTVEGVLFTLIIGLAIFTRLWDLDVKALHHDEGVHAYYSWRYYDGGGYLQEPWKHGPFLYHITALSFWLFGPGDFTARLPAALFGVLICLLPLALKRELGRWGALTASFLLAISPTFMYFSRFIREDIFMAFATLAVFIGLVRFVRQPSGRWWYILLASLGLLYCTKEASFFYTALFGGFIFLWLCWQIAPRLVFIFGAYLAVAAFTFFFVAALYTPPPIPFDTYSGPALTKYINDLLVHPIFWTTIILIVVGVGIGWFAFKEAAVARRDFLVATGRVDRGTSAAYTLFLPYEQGSVAYAIGWLGRHWKVTGVGLFIFFAIYSVLYTGFFSNPAEGEAGLIAGLWYWMGQQGVARGAQPWYYYFLMMPLYEPLALLFGTLGGLLAIYRFARYTFRRRVRRVLVPLEVATATPAKVKPRDEEDELDELEPLADEEENAGVSPNRRWVEKSIPQHQPGNSLWPSRLRREEHPYFVPLLLAAWAFGSLGFYTWASEKMPWLTIQVALPFILLAAYFFQPIWSGLEQYLGSRAARRFIFLNIKGRLAFWTLVGAVALSFCLAYVVGLNLSASALKVQVGGYPYNWILIWVAPMLLLLFWGTGGMILGSRVASRVTLGVAFAMLSLFLIKTATAYSFEQPDIPVEMGIYTQTAPDLQRTVKELDLMTAMMPDLKKTPILYDDEMRTPLDFYLRDYTKARKSTDFSPATLEANDIDLSSFPVIMMTDAKRDALDENQKQLLSTKYVSYHRVFRWWFAEEPYRNFDKTDQTEIDFLRDKVSKVTVKDVNGAVLVNQGDVMTEQRLIAARDAQGNLLDKLYSGNGGNILLLNVTKAAESTGNLANPQDFARLWRFVFFREQVQPLGHLDFTIYVRNDTAGLFRQFGDLVTYPISQP